MRRFDSGDACLALVTAGVPLFSESQGTSPSRPHVEVAYERQVRGLVIDQQLTYDGFSVWPAPAAERVRRLAADITHPLRSMPGNKSAEGPDAAEDLTLPPAETTALIRAGRAAFALGSEYEATVLQVVSIDLDHDGRAERLTAASFHHAAGANATSDELRDVYEETHSYAGIFLSGRQAPEGVRLLRKHMHTILGSVELAGDGRMALWLADHDNENIRYEIALLESGQLRPLGCYGDGPGNGPRTSCQED